MSKTVLFLRIEFSISIQFSSIWPIDRTLSGATTMSKPLSDGNERVLHIPQSTSITGTSPSDCLVPYPRHLLRVEALTPLQRSSRGLLQPQPTGRVCACTRFWVIVSEWECVYIVWWARKKIPFNNFLLCLFVRIREWIWMCKCYSSERARMRVKEKILIN